MTDQEAFELIFSCNLNHTREQLKKLQSLSLEQKIQATKVRIGEWYQHYGGKVYVSFSGGKDSTVLLHIARECFPDIEAVFVDTGLEYPEIRQFVKQHENVTILRPKMRFDEVIKKYGYPVISKTVSNAISEARHNILTETDSLRYRQLRGEEKDKSGNPSIYNMKKWAFLIESPFKITDRCCGIMKKNPFHQYEKQSGKKPLVGVMAEESQQREAKWYRQGCNAFSANHPQSTPMAFWTEQDVLQYFKITSLPYCSVYGKIVADNDGQTELFETTKHYHCTGCDRTGCMFCMFGVHLEPEPNRFQRMKITHPKQYDYCINQLGIGKVLDYIGVKYK